MGRHAFAVLASIALAGAAYGQSQLDGTWTWSGNDAERAGIASAIDHAVEGMNTISSNMARMRLAMTNQPAERIEVSVGESETILRFDGTDIRIPAEGSRRIRGPGGERARASQERQGNALSVKFQSHRGARHMVFEPAGRELRVRVRIESPHLTHDVRYALTYRR